MSSRFLNMSSITPQPEPPAADEIVAYLDGELPPQDCRRVESRLASDEGYRQQLHELDRAWEALDSRQLRRNRDRYSTWVCTSSQSELAIACRSAGDSTDQCVAIRHEHRTLARAFKSCAHGSNGEGRRRFRQ